MKILAIDYGERHTGLASCDALEIIAAPYKVLHENCENGCTRLAEMIAAEIAVIGAESVIVGNPVNNNGTEGRRSEICKAFADVLRGKLGGRVPVEMWDEFSSTIEANERLDCAVSAGKRHKRDRRGKHADIDGAAAAVILESYLNEKRLKRRDNRDT